MTPLEIDIRVVQSGDEDILTNVAADVFDDPLDEAATGIFMRDPRHHLTVAIAEGTVIGFASGIHYGHPDRPRPELWINEIGVAPAYRQHGVGQALLHALLAVGRRAECIEAWVLTDRQNMPAMRLCSSLGAVKAPDDTVMFTFRLATEGSKQNAIPLDPNRLNS